MELGWDKSKDQKDNLDVAIFLQKMLIEKKAAYDK
jgi:hypothetical protein